MAGQLLGSPLLALSTWAAVRGYGALAVATGTTVGAYAIDVIAGSPLTSLALLGPNPGLGVRFFGIGKELEALLAVLLVPAGIGAALAALLPALGGPVAVRLRSSSGYAWPPSSSPPGRFGADVGAAILPAGPRRRPPPRRAAAIGAPRTLLIVAAPFAVLALLPS